MTDGAAPLGTGLWRHAARTPTLPPATHTQSYALGQRQLLLVEPSTPYEEERREWLAWARGLASEGRELTALLVTHHHPDHVGGAAFLAGELGLPLWAHRLTAERLSAEVTRHLEDGEELLLAGPTPQRWRVLHTPGHAPGHLCLHEPELGALIVGDMVASEGTILIDPTDGDLQEYLAQLRRLEALGARIALPAHGEPIREPSALFARYVEHRLLREQRVVEALRQRPDATPEALLPSAYADTPPAVWGLAVRSLEAHLLKLRAEGRASLGQGGWRLEET